MQLSAAQEDSMADNYRLLQKRILADIRYFGCLFIIYVYRGEEMLRRALVMLGEWCEEWSVKINIDKCGVMHMR